MELDKKLQQSYLKHSIIFESSLGFFALLFSYFTDLNPLAQIKVIPVDILYGFLFCLPMVPLFFIISYLPYAPFLEIKKKLDETLLPLFKDFSWLDILLISLLAGVCEELMFRGWLEMYGVQYLGVLGSAICASILFGLAHFITPTYAIFATIMGAVLSFATWFTDNLLVAMIAHTAYDFFALAWYLKFRSPSKAQV